MHRTLPNCCFCFILFLFIISSAPFVAASEMTVIITQSNSSACRVLEADALDQAIPEGWVRLDLTKEQCKKALPELQAADYDANIKQYLSLLSCDKENNVKSLSYFGLGAKEICASAGLDYQSGRLVVGSVATPKKMDMGPYAIGIILVLLLVFLLLIIVKKKKAKLASR